MGRVLSDFIEKQDIVEMPRFVECRQIDQDVLASLARHGSPPNMQCQLCGQICRKAARLRCSNNPVCWNCAVKKITKCHRCWKCGESSITTEVHLVQYYELRKIIKEFLAIKADERKLKKMRTEIREHAKHAFEWEEPNIVKIEKRPWNSTGEINTSWLDATLVKIGVLISKAEKR